MFACDFTDLILIYFWFSSVWLTLTYIKFIMVFRKKEKYNKFTNGGKNIYFYYDFIFIFNTFIEMKIV